MKLHTVCLVVYLPRTFIVVECKLRQDRAGIKAVLMFMQVVAKFCFEYVEYFNSAIDTLMPCPGSRLGNLISNRNSTTGNAPLIISSISQISFHLLVRTEQVLQTVAKDPQVTPASGWVRSIYPTDVTCLYANSNFITEIWSVKLMRPPHSAKGRRLLYGAIRPIDGHLARLVTVAVEAIVQPYLETKEKACEER